MLGALVSERFRRPAWFLLAFFLVLVVGGLDYATGPEISVTLFYLLPIFLAAWKVGLVGGMVMTVLSSVAWFLADWVWEAPYPNPWIPYWNTLMRFGVFATAVFLIDRTKRLHQSLRHKALSLADEVAERARAEGALANEREILEVIAQGKPLPEVLGRIVQKTSSWSHEVYCSILVQNPDGQPLLHIISSGLELSLREAAGPLPTPVVPSRSSSESEEDRPASLREEWRHMCQMAQECGFHIAASKSMVSSLHEVLGIVTFFSRGAQALQTAQADLINRVTQLTAIALERQRSEETRRRLSMLLLQTQEAERRRVARELHDGVNQLLSSVAFRVEAISEQVSGSALIPDLTKVRWLLQRAIREVRHISENLRPSELDELGLVAALRDLCVDFNERGSMFVRLDVPAAPQRFSGEIELCLYRIAQEALTNASKHSEATNVALKLNWDDQNISLTVTDNGKGLTSPDLDKGSPLAARGMGLIDMRERSVALGGSFAIQSPSGEGTEILVRLPRHSGTVAEHRWSNHGEERKN